MDTERKLNLKDIRKLNLEDIDHAILRHLNSTYVIEKPFSFTSIINAMKRILKKVFRSKKPSLRTIHGLGPATSTLTSTGPTDLMLSIPACDSESISAQGAAGVSVSVQLFLFSPFASLFIDLLLLSRPPIIWESLPRFPPQRSVIFFL